MKRVLALMLFVAGLGTAGGEEEPYRCTFTPPMVVWKPWAPGVLQLTVHVEDPTLVAYCVGWGDGENFCRDVDEYPYTEVFRHTYHSCDPHTTIVVNFGKRVGDKINPARTARYVVSFHC